MKESMKELELICHPYSWGTKHIQDKLCWKGFNFRGEKQRQVK